MYEYLALPIRVVDGDTIHARLDLGFAIRQDMTLRLSGINAPEMSSLAGPAAKDYLHGLLFPANAAHVGLGWFDWQPPEAGAVLLVVQTEKDHREKYGRFLATLRYAHEWLPDHAGVSLNQLMLAAGHAVEYHGR